ncbi:glycosylphosphatidylinositol anchor attachment 1 protein isoform X1 [Cynara cardunculus var. scolymus]|uniref:glycosylphosphatidylinositol anchor attachment 1 protein isoform X1 n=1 Tax=Cynara cardunculus var. scolymus TaxID=59895 RepID=UPI000D6237BB|nr:glycosylphosphatidylinositol anchor attachment 1 protein isoform X1 [Cynara cardunculus var. scolymus]
MVSTAEIDGQKPKHRPIIRIGIFIIAHSFLVSVVCCTAGVLALLLLPVLAKKTYVSENALMPGSATPMLSDQDVSGATRFMNELTSPKLKSWNMGIELPRLIALHMSNLGGEVNYHKFQTQPNNFHPLYFFTSPDAEANLVNKTCQSYATNTIGIIRAPRGDGKEAIVLVTPYNPVNLTQSEVLSLGIAYSVFSLLTQVSWLAKDIIWLAADSQYGQYNSVAAWLRDYHTPSFGGHGKLHADNCRGASGMHGSKLDMFVETEVSDTFRRAGTMAAAFVIKVANTGEEGEQDSLKIYAEASNGQMPNLDLINVVSYLAVHGQGLRVKVEKLVSLLDSKWLNFIGEMLESVGKIARSLNPQWKFGIPVQEYVEGSATLVSSLYNQAIGVPTGSHGAFRDYQVDAITLEISPKLSSSNKARQTEFLFRGGRLIEGVVRSVNNLLEKFHQSFFLYLLTSSNKFISVGVYMIAFLLLVAPLPVVAASLFSNATSTNPNSQKHTSSSSEPFQSWRWLYPTKTIFLVHLWGAIVSLLPYFIYQIPECQPTSRLLIWASLSIFILAVLRSFFGSSTHLQEWVLLKSVTVSSLFIGLCLMSVINFATAEIGALILVPMCLMIKPWKIAGKAHSAFNLLLLTVGFPGAAFFVVKGAFGVQNGSGLVEFWYWVESLWAWNSATYIYICMVHLPCWVLCICILLHCC